MVLAKIALLRRMESFMFGGCDWERKRTEDELEIRGDWTGLWDREANSRRIIQGFIHPS
jgi:hypothetical protein